MGEVHQLELFEGVHVDTTEVKLTGKTAARGETYRWGQYVYFVVRGQVIGVNHEMKGADKDVKVRSHKVELISAVPVTVGDFDQLAEAYDDAAEAKSA